MSDTLKMKMSARKKKLSLKKSKDPGPGGHVALDGKGQNTIISMFKRQKEKQIINVDSEHETGEPNNQKEGIANTTDSSEGDVVITKVESTGMNSLIKIGRGIPESGSARSGSIRKKLSLRKTKKRKSSEVDDEDEFMPSKSKYFGRKKSKADQNRLNSPGRYNLRKIKTDPVLQLSDSDSEENWHSTSVGDEGTGCEKESSQKENVSDPKDTPKMSRVNEIKVNNTKGKLSLKKNKTESDIPMKSSSKLKRNSVETRSDLTDSSCSENNAKDKTVKQNSVEMKSDSLKQEINKQNSGSDLQKEDTFDDKDLNQNELIEVVDSNCENNGSANNKISHFHVQRKTSDCEEKMIGKFGSKNLNSKSDQGGNNSEKCAFESQNQVKNKTPVATYSIFNSKPNQQGKNIADRKSSKTVSTVSMVNEEIDDDSDDESKVDLLGNLESTENAEKEPLYKVPYYLENFRTILDTVLSDKENVRLFDDADMEYITIFNALDEAGQKLYVRLFSRRLAWLPLTRISYPEISDNIETVLDTLIHVGFVISGDELSDVSQILKVMAAPDLKTLAKSFHLNITGATKKQIIELLIKKSQQSSISSMFKGGGNVSTEKTMVTRAKSYLGKVCRLQDESRAVFIRLLMLFSLYNTNLDEESGSGGQNQLFQMLMANIGKVVYPSYTVNRQRAVFKDRAAVIRFEKALMFELEIQIKTVKNKWSEAYEVYQHAKEIGKDICSNKEFLEWDAELPLSLRSYSAGTIYTRIDSQGVEILQRLKKYKEAVKLLEELLSQELYCPEYRGHWYDRLALNLDAHLKLQEKCLKVIKAGLADPDVRPSRRYLLYQRAEKICGSPNSKYSDQLSKIEPVKITEAPEHYIEGMVMPDAGCMGMKYQFVLEGGEEGVTLCAVEELALEHYKDNGYPEGLHAEGSIISKLFLMFFWDIEFMDVPDVFHSPFQTAPLDMMTTDFYTSRRQQVDDRLDWLRTTDIENLVSEVGDIWEKHNGEMCAGINWEKFSGPQKLQGLVRCMGGEIIAGILERYVKDPRHTRSGFPDLTLWNTENKTFKISEVKGPGDRLSHKQILWLHYLLSLGVDAEVCYVKAVGSKKLKPVAKTSS